MGETKFDCNRCLDKIRELADKIRQDYLDAGRCSNGVDQSEANELAELFDDLDDYMLGIMPDGRPDLPKDWT